VQLLQGTTTLSSNDCELVARAFLFFVDRYQQVLGTLANKAGTLEILPLVGKRVADAIQLTNNFVIDDFAVALINIAEGECKDDIQQQQQALVPLGNLAVKKYRGING
jgi:hypothetical protein